MNNEKYKHIDTDTFTTTSSTNTNTNTDKNDKILDDINANVYSSYKDIVLMSNIFKDFVNRIYKINISLKKRNSKKETEDNSDEEIEDDSN